MQQNFQLRHGETFSIPLGFEQQVDGAWVAASLVGSELVFEAQWAGGSLEKSSDGEDGLSITDAAAGLALLALSEDEIEAMPEGDVPYRLRRLIGAEKKVVLEGLFKVRGWP